MGLFKSLFGGNNTPETEKEKNENILLWYNIRAEKNEENFLFPARKGGLSSLPFLDLLGSDSDLPLIIGLLLILFSEKADKKLLFALIYIML